MNKKIFLINPYPYYARGVEGTKYPPLGLLYIASFLRQHGYGNIKVYDANIAQKSNEYVIDKVEHENPQIVG
ncbi:MAG: B12-binding domain-containing radical SAM protein, partial [Candidatus Omnitrophota bacterium]